MNVDESGDLWTKMFTVEKCLEKNNYATWKDRTASSSSALKSVMDDSIVPFRSKRLCHFCPASLDMHADIDSNVLVNSINTNPARPSFIYRPL